MLCAMFMLRPICLHTCVFLCCLLDVINEWIMWGVKIQMFDHFCRDFRTRHHLSQENVASTNKNANVNLQYIP